MYKRQEENICNYTFIPDDETPQIASFTRTDENVTITYELPSGQNELNADDLTIYYMNYPCLNPNVNNLTITCTMEKNDDNTIKAENGEHYPLVLLKDKGYLKVKNGVTKEQAAIKMNSQNPDPISFGGGVKVTLTGEGFPATHEFANDFQIKFANEFVDLVSSSNTEIVFYTKEIPINETSDRFAIIHNNVTISYTLNTDSSLNPKIDSLSPTFAPPLFYTDLTITGSGFGTVMADIEVHIISTTNSELMEKCVISTVIDTQIECEIPHLETDIYKIRVFLKNDQEYSIPSSTDLDLSLIHI